MSLVSVLSYKTDALCFMKVNYHSQSTAQFGTVLLSMLPVIILRLQFE